MSLTIKVAELLDLVLELVPAVVARAPDTSIHDLGLMHVLLVVEYIRGRVTWRQGLVSDIDS